MILDAGAWLGRWPFGEVEPDSAQELMAHQAARGIHLSCVAALDAPFHDDPQPANERLFRELREHPTLEPVAVLNPALATWPRAFAECRERGVRQLRLTPNYHRYGLADPGCEKLLDAAARRGLRVAVQLRLEDERRQHPLMPVPAVPVEAVLELARRRAGERFVVLGAYRHEAVDLAAAPNLLVGIANVESLNTLQSLLADVPAAQVVFDTQVPLLCVRAAMVKVEIADLPAQAKAAVWGGNLAEWLGGSRDTVPWLPA
ncbi:MAG: hypothetical protein HYU66_01805 [Armatimonadetes bacterium]|nr:hypothetical protein [Armatimonadota bacterium]